MAPLALIASRSSTYEDHNVNQQKERELGTTAKLGIAGTLVFRDADGNVLKETAFKGSTSLEGSGLTAEQVSQLPIERISQ